MHGLRAARLRFSRGPRRRCCVTTRLARTSRHRRRLSGCHSQTHGRTKGFGRFAPPDSGWNPADFGSVHLFGVDERLQHRSLLSRRAGVAVLERMWFARRWRTATGRRFTSSSRCQSRTSWTKCKGTWQAPKAARRISSRSGKGWNPTEWRFRSKRIRFQRSFCFRTSRSLWQSWRSVCRSLLGRYQTHSHSRHLPYDFGLVWISKLPDAAC